VFFFFKETKQVSLEDIDLLFGERALGTLPDDLHKAPIHGVNEISQVEPSPVAADKQVKQKIEGEAV
jgi:hypothetical protein